ncbi:hypothetical protein LQW54_011361 [Pestalotiopsis sp. IQ-011]
MSVARADADFITVKKARYGRYVDTKQWDKFSEIALPHATLRFLDMDKNPPPHQLLDNVHPFYKSSYLYHIKRVDFHLVRGCNHDSGYHTHYFDCLNHYNLCKWSVYPNALPKRHVNRL